MWFAGDCASDSSAANVAPNVNDKTAVSLSRMAPPAISSTAWRRRPSPRSASTGLAALPTGPTGNTEDDDDQLWQSATDHDYVDVIAVHGNSVLFNLSRRLGVDTKAAATDYFLYRAGVAAAAAGRPPSLSLLPTCHIPMLDYEKPNRFFLVEAERVFHNNDTGLLRSGDDDGEFLVAQLQITPKGSFETFDMAELWVLRPRRHNWELKKAVPIFNNNCGRCRYDLRRWQDLQATVPVGNRFLCWANYDLSIFLMCDMAEENPKLQYVPLPVKALHPLPRNPLDDLHVEEGCWQYYQSIGAVPSAADDVAAPTVRFVSADNCYFCRNPQTCESNFVVTTWSMALNTTGEPMEWVKEGVLHSEELWAQLTAGYEDIPPRLCLTWEPVVSLENPDVVCFKAACMDWDSEMNGESWMLEVDMRTKTLISVVPCDSHAYPI